MTIRKISDRIKNEERKRGGLADHDEDDDECKYICVLSFWSLSNFSWPCPTCV